MVSKSPSGICDIQTMCGYAWLNSHFITPKGIKAIGSLYLFRGKILLTVKEDRTVFMPTGTHWSNAATLSKVSYLKTGCYIKQLWYNPLKLFRSFGFQYILSAIMKTWYFTCIRGCSTLTQTAAFLAIADFEAAWPVIGWLFRCSAAAMLCSKLSVLRSGPAPEQRKRNIIKPHILLGKHTPFL